MYDAFYKLTDSSSQIRSYVFDVVRATVPNMLLDDVRLPLFLLRGKFWPCPDIRSTQQYVIRDVASNQLPAAACLSRTSIWVYIQYKS